MTRLRAAYNDANERVFVSAQSLHGGIEASGKKQLRVLSTPHYKNTQTGSRCCYKKWYLIWYFTACKQSCSFVTHPEWCSSPWEFLLPQNRWCPKCLFLRAARQLHENLFNINNEEKSAGNHLFFFFFFWRDECSPYRLVNFKGGLKLHVVPVRQDEGEGRLVCAKPAFSCLTGTERGNIKAAFVIIRCII